MCSNVLQHKLMLNLYNTMKEKKFKFTKPIDDCRTRVVSSQTQLRPVHQKSADILKRNCFVSRSSCSADSSRDFKFKYSLHNAMK